MAQVLVIRQALALGLAATWLQGCGATSFSGAAGRASGTHAAPAATAPGTTGESDASVAQPSVGTAATATASTGGPSDHEPPTATPATASTPVDTHVEAAGGSTKTATATATGTATDSGDMPPACPTAQDQMAATALTTFNIDAIVGYLQDEAPDYDAEDDMAALFQQIETPAKFAAYVAANFTDGNGKPLPFQDAWCKPYEVAYTYPGGASSGTPDSVTLISAGSGGTIKGTFDGSF